MTNYRGLGTAPITVNLANWIVGVEQVSGWTVLVSVPGWCRNFSVLRDIHIMPGAHPASIQWVPEVKRPGREGDNPRSSSADVWNRWSLASAAACITSSLGQGILYVLGAFAKLQKATVSSVMSVRPSVCRRGTTRLQREGFFYEI